MTDDGGLRLALLQLEPVPGEPETNARAIATLAHRAGADVAITPELALTGYDVGDAVHELARRVEPGSDLGLEALRDVPGHLIAGVIETAAGGPYNTAAVLHGGRVRFRHRKLYLPTYGMFDEGRWFGRGSALDVWCAPNGWRVGLLICEDFWHPALAYVLAARGIDVLLVQAAAPGRGAWEGGTDNRFASADVWERIARTTAQLYGIFVGLCNRTGVEGAVTFAGGSLVAGPDGGVLARAGDRGEEALVVELTRARLESARRPYDHARDDDVRLVVRELQRGLTEP
jgi:predicted amidohydrolase